MPQRIQPREPELAALERIASLEKNPANGGMAASDERADQEHAVRPGQLAGEPAHAANVLLAGEGVDDDARGHEEERLEEGVRHQVEEPGPVGAQPDADEHVADLAHRRVRDHTFDVRLDERDEPGDEQGHRAQHAREVAHVHGELEERARAGDQVDAGGHHRRRVDECADRRRALHRVGEPRVERDLRRLGDGAAEEPERDQHRERRVLAECLRRGCEDRREVQGPDLLDEDEEREREGRVADRVHDEGLLAGRHGLAPAVPVVDQQVGREADHAPAGQEQQEVPRLDEQEHGEDEERLVGVVARLLLVAVHVADRVGEDEEADAGDDQHHEDRERIDQDLGAEAQVARGQPGPGSRHLRAFLGLAAEQLEEDGEGAEEREAGRGGGDHPRAEARDPAAQERDHHDGNRGREQRRPGEDVHAATGASAAIRDRSRLAIGGIRPSASTAGS